VSEVLHQDFATTLRAKGSSELAVIRHVPKNSAPQVLAVMGLQFWLPDGRLDPGGDRVHLAGQRLHAVEGAIINRDIPLQGTIPFLSMTSSPLNLVVDLVQSLIDPRGRPAFFFDRHAPHRRPER
jgi:peptide/nickel transport system permease protein